MDVMGHAVQADDVADPAPTGDSRETLGQRRENYQLSVASFIH